MKLPNLKEHCGCDDRRFIMFEAGKLGLTEAFLLAIVIGTLVIVWRKNA